jgi:hypothetical protein
MTSAWRKSYSGMSTEEWLPPADPERPRRDDHRSTEAIARRREIRTRRGYELDAQPRPAAVAAPTPNPAESERLLVEAENLLLWGMRATESAFLSDVAYVLKTSRERAMEIADELVRQGRLERTVAPNGFVTLQRRRKSK